MKASQFVELLRKVVREEVRTVVRKELQVLTEQTKMVKQPIKQTTRPVRSTPLVTFDDNDLIGSLLNETANTMSMEMENTTEIPNPEFPGLSGNDTMQFVKDYSHLLKKAEEININK